MGYIFIFSLVHLSISLPNFVITNGIVGGGYYTFANIWYKGNVQSSKYDNYRVKFLNRQGSWNYWNFNKDSQQTTEITRTEFKRPLQYDYTLDTTNPAYTTSKLRGQAVLSSNATETFTLNSNWITEDEYTFLNQLFSSPEVYLYIDNGASVLSSGLDINGYPLSNQNGVNIPLIITGTSYVFKTLNRDKLFNLTITFKYAFDTNLQNQ